MSLIFEHSVNTSKVPAKRGYGWVKTVYKNLLFNECQCEGCTTLIIFPKRKCEACVIREEEERIEFLRWKTCSKCGTRHYVEEDSVAAGRVCVSCREKRKWRPAHFVLRLLFLPFNPLRFLPMDERIDAWSALNRNIIQDITGTPEFKRKNLKFENVPDDATTWDHVNSMKSSLKHYLTLCVENRKYRRYKYFKHFLRKYYGVQYRVTAKQNRDLAPLQAEGITPKGYLSIVGNVVGKTLEESVELIKQDFIYQDAE